MFQQWIRLLFISTWFLVALAMLFRREIGLDAMDGRFSDESIKLVAYMLMAFAAIRAALWFVQKNRSDRMAEADQAARRRSRQPLQPREPASERQEYLPEFNFTQAPGNDPAAPPSQTEEARKDSSGSTP